MDKLKPKLFSVLKNYTAAQFGKDVVAGVIVAIIALPKWAFVPLFSRDLSFPSWAEAACRSRALPPPLLPS